MLESQSPAPGMRVSYEEPEGGGGREAREVKNQDLVKRPIIALAPDRYSFAVMLF